MKLAFKSLYLFLAFSTAFYCSYGQTCIIIVRSSQGICVGTDTRIKNTYEGIERSDTVCKIRKSNNIYVSVSGLNTAPVYETALSCIKSQKSLEEIGKDFVTREHTLRQQYLDSLRGDKINFAKSFNKLQKLEVAFYGFENGISKILPIVFILDSHAEEPIHLTDSVYTNYLQRSKETNVIAMGHCDDVRNILFDPEFWAHQKAEDGVEQLINIECRLKPQEVGKPIDVLLIYNEKEFKWVKGSARCSF
jgi:hypothetical protein